MNGDVVRFPFEKTLGSLPNDPRMEWLFIALDGHGPAGKKRLLMLARQPEVAFIDDRTCEILIDALGLREA